MIGQSLVCPVLLFLTACSSEKCGEGHCRDNSGFYMCEGKAGEEITIPCGPLPEMSDITFTYKNKTSGVILLRNSTECLKVNLTTYDNENTEISCEPSTSQAGAAYTYDILVQYAPQLLGDEQNNPASFHLRYDLQCPLKANPTPYCVWDMYWCNNNSAVNIDNEIFLDSDSLNCSLRIEAVTVKYRNICFNCVAFNALGMANTSLSILLNETSLCQPEQSITVSPQISNDNALELQQGQNITLRCTVIGVERKRDQHWEFLSSTGVSMRYNGENEQFNIETCTQIIELSITEASMNVSGNYTCVYNNELTSNLQIRFIQEANLDERSNPNTFPTIFGSVTGFVAFVVLLLVVAAIIAFLFRRSCVVSKGGLPFEMFYHTEYDGNEEYDIFLSFAEEDRETAELVIKRQLEEAGYSVCWHHDAFLPGYTIEDNMERSVFMSRYTVVLISQAFLSSQFCYEELNLTKRKMQEISRNCLIPVIIDDECDIPPELLKITYVNIKDKALIERLKAKLGAPLIQEGRKA